MYLTYNEYHAMGGTLEKTAFERLCRKAEYIINSQANGRTGERISKLTEFPQAVKDCTFELITHLSCNSFDGSGIQSESQSLGGQSESVTYLHLTKEQSETEINNIIYGFLCPVKINGVSILYSGACI